MPIYGFSCQACGHQFDRLQKLSDPDPDICPECSAKALHRQVSAPSFRLAGGGWYETDFKGKNEKRHNLAGDGKAESSGSGGKSDGSTDKSGGKVAESQSKPADGGSKAAPASP